MFNELTYSNGDCEVMVQIDVESKLPIDIYTYKRDKSSLPESMRPFFAIPSKNPLFIKSDKNNLSKVYNLVKRHFAKCESEKE